MSDFTENDPVIAERGIPFPLVKFSGGRLAVDLAAHGGLTEIRYFGEQRLSDAKLFKADPLSAFSQCFRPYVDFGKHEQYFLEFNKTRFYPFGYDSECEFRGIIFRHRLTLLNDALIFELESGTDAEFELKLGVTFAGIPIHKATRTWTRFLHVPNEEAVIATCIDEYEDNLTENHATVIDNRINAEPSRSSTVIAVGSASPFRFNATAHDIQKDYFNAAAQNGYAAIAVVFGAHEQEACRRLREVAVSAQSLADTERQRFRQSIEVNTTLISPDPVLNSFVRNMPEILYSMEVKDIPGAVCASNAGYWVWGWDSMVHTDAMMMSGDWDAVLRRLRYYRDTADPERGIFHAINCAGKGIATMASSAQTIYCIMLYNYFLYSRDLQRTAEFYDFAANLLNRVEPDLVQETGLYQGTGLYPDFPEDLGQTGNDISSFNNSILYQAFRAMSELAIILEHNADSEKWNMAAERLRFGFRKFLYDSDKHYFYDSIDALTLRPRKYYPVYAVLYLTSFAEELIEGVELEVAAFMERSFTQRHGISMFARNDDIFYSDGNQLGFYSPVTEHLYRHMMRKIGTKDSLLPIIVADWSKLQCSEATSCEAINMGITPDAPGKKQMYSAVSYYSSIFHMFCGLEVTSEALKLNTPTRAADGWKIERFKIGENEFTIEFIGCGENITRTILDDSECPENQIILKELNKRKHNIKVYKGKSKNGNSAYRTSQSIQSSKG